MVRGMILISEVVTNLKRKFGARPNYIPVWVREPDGSWGKALFTRPAINAALDRGRKNPEDLEAAFGDSKPPSV